MRFGVIKRGYLKRLAVVVWAFLIPIQTTANPAGGHVTHGQAGFDLQGKTLNITNTSGTIINWQDFSIATDETTRFIQQSRDSAVLNRITGQNPSSILGTLQSNGQVYLINPNGIVFGQNAQINVAGLVASTLNMTDADFLNGRMNFTGNNNALLQNFGIIETSDGGDIYLIGSDIENHGIIKTSSGNILLAAGESVSIVDSTAPEIEVQITAPDNKTINVGEIITQNGQAGIYAGLIEHQGIVKANTAVVEGGKIVLKAKHGIHLKENSVLNTDGNTGGQVTVQSEQGETLVEGNISAKGTQGQGGTIHVLGEYVGLTDTANINASGQTDGGTVLIGGDNKGQNPDIQNAKGTYVALGSEIHADAGDEGDGGTVIVWSDDATRAYGTITAKGGATVGNGGFVETSGGYLDVANIDIDIAASNGDGGIWLLDPYDITINATSANYSSTGLPVVYTPTGTGSNIPAATLATQLNAGNSVIVDTTGGGAEAGNITVDASISKTVATGNPTITLKAHNNIIINQPIEYGATSSAGSLGISLIADQDSNSSGAITLNARLFSNSAPITLSAYGDILFNATGQNSIETAQWFTDTVGNVSVTSTGGSIIRGTGGIGGSNNATLSAANGITGIGYINWFPVVSRGTISATNTTSGNIEIQDGYNGAVTFSANNSAGNVYFRHDNPSSIATISSITANGSVKLRSNDLTISGPVNAGANSVYILPAPTNAIISIAGTQTFDLTQTDIQNITAGNIFIGNDPLYGTGFSPDTILVAPTSAINFGGRNVWLTSRNGVSVGNNSIINNGGEFYIDNVISGSITTGTANISSDKIQFRSIGNINIGAGGLTGAAGNNLILSASDINVSGAISGATNALLYPYVANTPISIGGSQTFDLTQADLNNFSTGTIQVGATGIGTTVYSSTADIASLAAVNIGSNDLRVYATGNMTVGNNSFTGGSITLRNFTGSGTFTSNAGQITTSSGLNILYNGIVNIGSGGINSNFTNLRGVDVNIGGTVSASGPSSIQIAPFISGTAMSVGGAQTFNLSQADVSNLSAGLNNIYLGSISGTKYASNIDIATNQSISSSEALFFDANGNINFGNNTYSTTSSLSAYALGAITTSNGFVSSNSGNMTAGTTLSIGAGGISSGTGGFSGTAPNGITQSGNVITTGGGGASITFTTSNGTISMVNTVNTSTNGGNITYSANGNVSLGRLYTGVSAGTVSVTSTTGSINDAGAGNENIYASVANLTASTSIGGGGFDVFFNNLGTTNLNATSSSGGISINSTSAVNVGNINSGTGTTNLTTSGGGSYLTTTGSTITGAGVSLNSSQNLTIGAGGINSAGNMSLTAAGTLFQSGNISTTAGGAILANANSATFNNITSTGNIGIETDAITITNPINAGTNNVYIMPRNNNAISIDGVAAFDLTQGELNNITAGNLFIGSNGGATTRATTASISTNASTTIGATTTTVQALNGITFGANNFTATGADISFKTVNAGTNITTGTGLLTAGILDLFAPGTVTVGSGGINATTDAAISAGGIALNGTVTTPILYLEPYAPGTAISVGGARPFDINQADINNIAATTTYIGNNSFIQNANNANLATATAIDFGARNIIIDANNGIQTGAFTLAATGGNLTLVSRNAGFDITTNAGNLAANNITLTSARDIIVGAGGLNTQSSVTATAANNINQNGNITCGGPGNVALTASAQNITMAAGTVTNSGTGNINYNAGGNITLALLDSNGANTTINATGAVLDVNGNGVKNVNANVLTVSSGGNASLDYTALGGVNSSGVVGLADLRDMNAGGTTTTTTTTATTTGTTTTTTATNTIVETIAATTSETTATTSPGDTLLEQNDETTDTTGESTATDTTTDDSKSDDEKEDKETQVAATETKDDKPKTLTKKNLRTCN